ncbi:hypothetical protein BGZ96_004292, partial [Linnemannia gamsii]
SCTFSAKNLSNSSVLGLIFHLKTLTSITINDKYVDDAAMRWLYVIPKSCSHLEVLSMKGLVLTMATVKEHEWECRYLRDLRVRFKGLEDAQLIYACIIDVRSQRQRPYRANIADSISAQVSRHLIQFSKLSIVSLGTKVMKVKMINNPKNPLDLPEIRALVASFLDHKDCLSCMCVSRDWFKDFVTGVWYSIDLAKDTKFVDLSPQVINKYGHYIRQVSNILTYEDVKALMHPTLDSVTSISVTNHINPYHRAIELDFIRRNNASLTTLSFHGPTPEPDTFEELYNRNENYLEPSLLISCSPPSTELSKAGSHLTRLSLSRVCITHEGFTNILRSSPVLRKLQLSKVIVCHYNPIFEQFQNWSVTSLHASLAGVCCPSPHSGWSSSLLPYFSHLEEWHFPAVNRPSNWSSDANFRRELQEYNPRLKTLRFDPVDDNDLISDLLFDSFRLIESCTFSATNLSQGMVLSLISHFNTLTTIRITDNCTDDAILRWLYLIPKSCIHLEVLSMQELILDMTTVEGQEWACWDLKELRVRFKGLEDSQLIDECLRDVCFQRQNPSRSSAINPISLQVSRHLLKFDKLTNVSLGTKVFYIPLSAA